MEGKKVKILSHGLSCDRCNFRLEILGVDVNFVKNPVNDDVLLEIIISRFSLQLSSYSFPREYKITPLLSYYQDIFLNSLIKNSRHPSPFLLPSKEIQEKILTNLLNEKLDREEIKEITRVRHQGVAWSGFREARRFDEGRDWAKDNGCLAVALSTAQSRSLRSMQH